MFGRPNPDEAAQEDLMFLQASTQMNELLNSWDLAFSQRDPGSPAVIDAHATASTAASLLDDMMPEESRPQVELPAELPSCFGHESLLRQTFVDVYRFLAGLGGGHSKVIVTGTVLENEATFKFGMPDARCTDKEIRDYLHDDEEPSRCVYALVGARFMMEKQGGRLGLTSSKQTGAVVRVTMPC